MILGGEWRSVRHVRDLSAEDVEQLLPGVCFSLAALSSVGISTEEVICSNHNLQLAALGLNLTPRQVFFDLPWCVCVCRLSISYQDLKTERLHIKIWLFWSIWKVQQH